LAGGRRPGLPPRLARVLGRQVAAGEPVTAQRPTQRSGPAADSGAAPLVSRTHSHMDTCWSWAIVTARITVPTASHRRRPAQAIMPRAPWLSGSFMSGTISPVSDISGMGMLPEPCQATLKATTDRAGSCQQVVVNVRLQGSGGEILDPVPAPVRRASSGDLGGGSGPGHDGQLGCGAGDSAEPGRFAASRRMDPHGRADGRRLAHSQSLGQRRRLRAFSRRGAGARAFGPRSRIDDDRDVAHRNSPHAPHALTLRRAMRILGLARLPSMLMIGPLAHPVAE